LHQSLREGQTPVRDKRCGTTRSGAGF
jgi:hypothetical protein